MQVVKTGMFWVKKEDLTLEQLNNIRNAYIYKHPFDESKVFPTYIELNDKVGLPAGNTSKAACYIDLSNYEDKTVTELVERPISLTGLTLRGYQEKALSETLDYFNSGGTSFNLSGQPGCVDEETEFLTKSGWKKISDYTKDDMVLQVDKQLCGTFVKPTDYIMAPATDWYNFYAGKDNVMKLSGEHRVIYETSKGNMYEQRAEQLYKNTPRIRLYSNVTIFNKGTVIFSDDEIRLIVAVAADGSMTGNSGQCSVNLKKSRKIVRFKKLLDAVGIPYKYKEKSNGYTVYTFKHVTKTKSLVQLWDVNPAQLEVIYDEFVHWDGWIDPRTNGKQFYTTIKEEADFIQYVIMSKSTCRVSINIQNRVGQTYKTGGKEYIRKSIEYEVNETAEKRKSITPKRQKTYRDKIVKTKSNPGEYKYCFTVPTGMFLARRGDFIFVTGNSGKSVMLSAIIAKLGVKTLVIAHLSMLTTQLQKEVEQFTDADIRVLDANNLELGDVNIATSQFISKRPELWYKIKKHIGLIAVDESEAIGSETTLRILQRAHAKYRIAITATFTRSVDGRTPALIDMIGNKVITLVNDKLIKPTIISVQCDEYFSVPRNKNLYKRQLVKFFRDNTSITEKVIQITSASIKKGRQVLIATDLTEFQELYASKLSELGYVCGIMNGKTSKDSRNDILERYDKGKIDVLIGFGVLNAGLSIPRISTIIRVSTPGNTEKLEQLVGRGRRDFEGKEGMWFIDLMFSGFSFANDKRRRFYNKKKQEEDWTYSSTTWGKFKEIL